MGRDLHDVRMRYHYTCNCFNHEVSISSVLQNRCAVRGAGWVCASVQDVLGRNAVGCYGGGRWVNNNNNQWMCVYNVCTRRVWQPGPGVDVQRLFAHALWLEQVLWARVRQLKDKVIVNRRQQLRTAAKCTALMCTSTIHCINHAMQSVLVLFDGCEWRADSVFHLQCMTLQTQSFTGCTYYVTCYCEWCTVGVLQ